MVRNLGGGSSLITFIIDGREYQAEEGMTFYDWAMSEYYDSNIPLTAHLYSTLRESCELLGNTSAACFNGGGLSYIPDVQLNSVIQPISYIVDTGAYD